MIGKYEKVKVAVVGCGAISNIYLENMTKNFSILEVVGCCDLKQELADAAAAKYNIKVMTMEEIIADKSIEMVINLTPPLAHYSVIKQLLNGSKNVYTEKPLASELTEVEELVKLADEKNLYLGASPDTFLGSAIQTAKEVVHSGLIGEVTSCTASINRDYSFMAEYLPYCVKKCGGVGFDVGIYYMTALVYMMGPVKEVAGFQRTNHKERPHSMPKLSNYQQPYTVECETVMVGSMTFSNGVLGTVMFNSDSILPEYHGLVLYGTEGILYMANPDQFGGNVSVIRKGHTEPFVIQQNHGFAENSRGVGAAEMAWSIRNDRKNRANKEMAYNALEALHGIVI